MKIIYIVNVDLPGLWAHSIQIIKMCEGFVVNGQEVELLSGLKRESDEKIFSYYNVRSKFKITSISQFNLSPGSASKLNFLIRTISFLLFAKLYIRSKKYDILYFRIPLAGLFFKNYYLEVHSLPPRIKYWHNLAFRRAKKIIVITGFLKKELVGLGVDEAKIIVAPDAVDLADFEINLTKDQARQKLSLPPNKKIIAYCGNFYYHDWKGVDILLGSLKYLDNVCCLLVGGNESELAKIKKHFAGQDLILTGSRAHKEIPFFLKAADILILPNKKGSSISEYYTSPLKLFEYMASGRPIVASGLPSIKEILNADNSVLVEPGNPGALAEGIKKVLKDGQFADKIAQQALLDVQNYTWQKRAKAIMSQE